jgi:hypothetical protein
VAESTGHSGVLSRQWETGGGVVERSSSPRGNGMAGSALRGRRWKTRGDVIRHVPADGGRALERSGVAAIAIRGIQRVIIVGVARRARCREVRSGQRKSGDAVVERRTIPTCGGVTVGAIPHRERCAGSGMHWIVGSLPRSQMALRISAAIQGNL